MLCNYMKKNTLLLILVALLSFQDMWADDYGYLTFTFNNGNEQSIATSGLKMTFAGNTVTIQQGGATTTMSVSELQKMYFSAEPSGIGKVTQETTGPVRVFTLTGTEMGLFANLNEAQARLPRGIYVMKQQGQTIKLTVK